MTTATSPEPAAVTPPPRLGPVHDQVEALRHIVRMLPPGVRATVSPVRWADYVAVTCFRDAERPAVQIAYTDGEVQFVTTSRMHEVWKTALAGLILCVAEEMGLPLAPCGHMTIRREDLARGFEADDCYYIRSAHRVMPVRELDFTTDPAPDLVLEIEHTRSAENRLGIYAAFRVPELWRYDGETLTVMHLNAAGEYTTAAASLSFPQLPLTEFRRFLDMATAVDLATAVRGLRAWLRGNPAQSQAGGQ